MAAIGRNDPCPCGSRRKAKRCCGVPAGPPPDQVATVRLNAEAEQWAPMLVEATSAELDEIHDDVLALPRRHASLRLRLPRLLPPALERLGRAVSNDDRAMIRASTLDAVTAVDTPSRRADLARAIVALHDDGHQVDCETTAYAVLDLAAGGHSHVLVAALIHSLEVEAGAVPTASGLLVASH